MSNKQEILRRVKQMIKESMSGDWPVGDVLIEQRKGSGDWPVGDVLIEPRKGPGDRPVGGRVLKVKLLGDSPLGDVLLTKKERDVFSSKVAKDFGMKVRISGKTKMDDLTAKIHDTLGDLKKL